MQGHFFNKTKENKISQLDWAPRRAMCNNRMFTFPLDSAKKRRKTTVTTVVQHFEALVFFFFYFSFLGQTHARTHIRENDQTRSYIYQLVMDINNSLDAATAHSESNKTCFYPFH